MTMCPSSAQPYPTSMRCPTFCPTSGPHSYGIPNLPDLSTHRVYTQLGSVSIFCVFQNRLQVG